MKHPFLAAACSFVLVAGATTAFAAAPDASHARGGLGFHEVSAPIGLRWWLSGEKVGIDAAFGFNSTPASIDSSEKVLRWAIDLGVPMIMHSWNDVHVIFRPGFFYQSQEIGFDRSAATPGVQFDTDTRTTMVIQAELEAEVFLRENVSVSASHGIGFVSVDPGFGGDNRNSFGTFGNNFTNVGFHVYFLGAGR